MNSILKKLNYKFLTRKSLLESALIEIIGLDCVFQFLPHVRHEDLIEACAKHRTYSLQDILRETATKLNLRPAFSLMPASNNLYKKSGFTIEQLQEVCAVLQPSANSLSPYELVIANPDIIDVKGFQAHNIPVHLSIGSWIRKALDSSSSVEKLSTITPAQVIAGCEQIASFGVSLGASEIVLGAPETNLYRFIAAGQEYRGPLHPQFYPTLLEYLEKHEDITLTLKNDYLVKMRISHTDSSITLLLQTTPSLTTKTVDKSGNNHPSDKDITPVSTTISSPAHNSQSTSVNNFISTTDDSTPQSILLVDDDVQFSIIVSSLLKQKGWEVIRKQNGIEAMDYINGPDPLPHLIVCDVHMPEMDGGTFLKQLRAEHYSVPTLMLTSDDNQILEAELAMIGADAFVRKQDNPKLLVAWCHNLLSRGHTHDSVQNDTTTKYHSINP